MIKGKDLRALESYGAFDILRGVGFTGVPLYTTIAICANSPDQRTYVQITKGLHFDNTKERVLHFNIDLVYLGQKLNVNSLHVDVFLGINEPLYTEKKNGSVTLKECVRPQLGFKGVKDFGGTQYILQ